MPQSKYTSEIREKDMLREEIAKQTEEYLSKGGKIKWYPPEHNKHGMKVQSKREKRQNSRQLTQLQLMRIDLMRKDGMTYSNIAKEFTVSSSTLQRQYKDWLWEGGKSGH